MRTVLVAMCPDRKHNGQCLLTFKGEKMKKALIVLFLLLIAATVFVSCKQEPEDPYKAYPFDGKTYKDPVADASVFEGTYLVGDYQYTSFFGYGNKFFVTLKSDGTFIISPQTGYLIPQDKACTTGTWSISGSTMTITVFGNTFSGTKNDVEGAGFSIKKSSYEGLLFAKLTDNPIDTTAFSNRKLDGLYMKVDSYGANYGYRFLTDGTVWYYSTDKKSSKGTYKISTNGTMINVNDSLFDNFSS